jgi:hypothetical protein
MTSTTHGVELTFYLGFPEMDPSYGELLVVADGETPKQAEARALTIGRTATHGSNPTVLQCMSVPPEDFPGAFTDVRGRSWYKDDYFHMGLLLPSYWELLERVVFQDANSEYPPVGLAGQPPLWKVHRVGGRWPEWLVFDIDARSFGRSEALTLVEGDVEHLRCLLMEMGCNLSLHEKEQLRIIRGQLNR